MAIDNGAMLSRACEHMSFALREMGLQPPLVVLQSRYDLEALKSKMGSSLIAGVLFRDERVSTVRGKKIIAEDMRIGDIHFGVVNE